MAAVDILRAPLPASFVRSRRVHLAVMASSLYRIGPSLSDALWSGAETGRSGTTHSLNYVPVELHGPSVPGSKRNAPAACEVTRQVPIASAGHVRRSMCSSPGAID